MKEAVFRIDSNVLIAKNTYEMELTGDVSDIKRPGQFVNIKLDGFFLRRPISVCSTEDGRMTLIYKAVGEGTELMAGLAPGTRLNILTGLGNGFDTSLAEGVYLLTPFSADASDDLTKNFVANYQSKYGETPNQFAADAYDCVYAIAQAIEASGITSDMSNVEIKDALVGQFTSMTFNGLTGTDVNWNASGEVSKAPKAVVIENGVYVGVED